MKTPNNAKKILIMLAFFAVSIGLWGNFRQLWLAENLLSAAEIAKTMSYASLLAVLYLIYYTKVVSIQKIQLGVSITLILKITVTVLLATLNGCGNIHLIKFLFFVDTACENILLSSIYPFITSFQKEEDLYGRKTVIEHTFKTIGILIGSLLFGRVIFSKLINYNVCLQVSTLFLIIALIIVLSIKLQERSETATPTKGFLRYILKQKTIQLFIWFTFFAQISYNIAIGLNMLIITNYLEFSANRATNYLLLFSILASIFGKLALKQLRSKNDYINFLIKFLGRTILYILIFITNSKTMLILGISYLLLTNVAYDYVISGFVYDIVEEQYIMNLTTIQYIINLIGSAIGIFLAGIFYDYGFRYIYLFAAGFMIIQIIIGIRIIYLKRKTKAI